MRSRCFHGLPQGNQGADQEFLISHGGIRMSKSVEIVRRPDQPLTICSPACSTPRNLLAGLLNFSQFARRPAQLLTICSPACSASRNLLAGLLNLSQFARRQLEHLLHWSSRSRRCTLSHAAGASPTLGQPLTPLHAEPVSWTISYTGAAAHAAAR